MCYTICHKTGIKKMPDKQSEDEVLNDIDFDMSLFDEDAEAETVIVKNQEAPVQRLKPKVQLLHFLTDVKMDEEFDFRFVGSIAEAKAYIHAMRVELSRLRDKVRKLGKRNIVFSVVVVSVVKEGLFNNYIVTLKRTQNKENTAEPIAEAVLDALTE